MADRIVPLRLFPLAAVLALSMGTAHAAPSAGDYSLESLTALGCEGAVKRLNEGIEARNPQALYTGSVLFDEGGCVEKNEARALELLKASVAAGHQQAAATLALRAGLGDGIKQDYAQAGAVLAKAGIKVGADDDADAAADYTRGYAYTWLRAAQRSLKYPTEMRGSGVRGSTELKFEPAAGVWKAGVFRRSANSQDGPSTGSRVDRSRGMVAAAVDEAAQKAGADVPKPDPSRLVPGQYAATFTIAPGADEMPMSIGVMPIIGNVPMSPRLMGN